MRWNQGREQIEQQLADGHLQKVPASRGHADRLLKQAHRHLSSVRQTAAADPEGAYALLYDAGRKALWAVLANQGLRPTSIGGHLVAYHAVTAQLDPPKGKELRPFDRMRRHRRDAEYPRSDAPEMATQDVIEDVPRVEAIIAIAERVPDQMSPF